MVKGHISGVTGHNTTENGSAISSMDKESTNGPMVDGMREAGRKISYTSKVSTHGQTAGSMMENMMRIKSMGMAFISGQTVKSTRGTGVTVNSTDRADSQIRLARVALECGSTEIDRNGCQVMLQRSMI